MKRGSSDWFSIKRVKFWHQSPGTTQSGSGTATLVGNWSGVSWAGTLFPLVQTVGVSVFNRGIMRRLNCGNWPTDEKCGAFNCQRPSNDAHPTTEPSIAMAALLRLRIWMGCTFFHSGPAELWQFCPRATAAPPLFIHLEQHSSLVMLKVFGFGRSNAAPPRMCLPISTWVRPKN